MQVTQVFSSQNSLHFLWNTYFSIKQKGFLADSLLLAARKKGKENENQTGYFHD
jgi:hypothetical protein